MTRILSNKTYLAVRTDADAAVVSGDRWELKTHITVRVATNDARVSHQWKRGALGAGSPYNHDEPVRHITKRWKKNCILSGAHAA